tara:strand:+ start:7623 stop:9008 length:1386 start_codon:yes stop_codon:yes gene_type:complete
MYMAFSNTGPLDLQTIGQAAGDTAPHSLSEYYNISFTDGTSTPSAGTISISDFLGKTIGSSGTGTWTEQARLVSPDASSTDFFGLSVSISGNYAVVGAYREDPVVTGGTQTDGGAAYVYYRSGTTWYFQARLTPTDLEHYDNFGFSVAIDGDYVIVGSRYEDPGGTQSAGAAYIFVRSGTSWSQQQKLIAYDKGQNDQFGFSVAIDGLTAIVGAPRQDHTSTDTGSVYVFVRSGTSWYVQQQLTASDPGQNDQFGFSVAIDGDNIIVGSPYEDPGNVNSAGSAYIFVRSGTSWSQQAKLSASDKESNALFGHRVDIDGNYVVVGAYVENPGAGFFSMTDAGSAYIFVRSGTSWSQQQKLTASDKAYYDRFGSGVAIEGSRVVIGAVYEDDGGTNSGATYVFDRSGSTWTQTIKLINSDASSDDRTGLGVSLSGNYFITGSYYHTVTGAYQQRQGAAYIYII